MCGRVHSPCVWICVYSDVCVCVCTLLPPVRFVALLLSSQVFVVSPLLSCPVCAVSPPLLSSPLRSVQSLLLSSPLRSVQSLLLCATSIPCGEGGKELDRSSALLQR